MEVADAWEELEAHGARLRENSLRALIGKDPDRPAQMATTACGITLDLSKEKLDPPAMSALLALARACDLEAERDAMARGDIVNGTEKRTALHMALRGSVAPPTGAGAAETKERFLDFAEKVRGGAVTAAGGRITDVINIGIGGSDLGPAMAAQALRPYLDGPAIHFVSNVDGAHFADTVRNLDPRRTLVVICSKSFSTPETMANARLAKGWLGDFSSDQMAAVSSNTDACAEFGIPEDRVFGIWDWVGGRYSLWSAIGLSLAIGIGRDRFEEFLSGAAEMDRHFLEAPLDQNLPVLYGLSGIWRRNILGYQSVAFIPYDQRLSRLSAYLQQLKLESLGKSVSRDGSAALKSTSAILWGEPGANAQHSFFQLLHQGSDVIPVDFLAAITPTDADADHHRILLSNCLAQSRALAFGRSEAEVAEEMRANGASEVEIDRLAPHRACPGDRPSTVILFDRLTPARLGALLAFFEHEVFVQSVVWEINPFDQWGVELGKRIAARISPALETGDVTDLDPSTAALICWIRGASD
ncbi:MAG: glucose-6-phosphate isomerase [Pseudomonadota bacterium]